MSDILRKWAITRVKKMAMLAANNLEHASILLRDHGEQRGADSYAAMAEGVKKLAENTR